MTSNPEFRSKVLTYLREHNAMSLATLSEGQPWAAAVFYVHDDRINLYFLSDPKARHSQQLMKNPRVSVAINEDYRDWREIKGIQLEGIAGKVTSPVEKARALTLYLSKFPFVRDFVTSPLAVLTHMAIAGKPFSVEVYKVTPERLFYLDNETGFSHRAELPLK
ncbi:MAG: hypothetical protein HW414_372 [Dehalococcoidia bacterium]|nr:hypothetical protein [Dehalococcoidia bacterium]